MSGLSDILISVMSTETNISNITDEEILKLNEENRTKCEIWTRTMGYHRPISTMTPVSRASTEKGFISKSLLARFADKV